MCSLELKLEKKINYGDRIHEFTIQRFKYVIR